MQIVQESKLLFMPNQKYKFRQFIRDNTWREVKVSARELLEPGCFKSIDYSFFTLYQIEIGLQRLCDYNDPGIPEDLLKTAKVTIQKSINCLRKYDNMDLAIESFDEWVKANDKD